MVSLHYKLYYVYHGIIISDAYIYQAQEIQF